MDKKILEETYQKFQKELYLYLFSLCQNRQLTEDLLQETFLKALLSLSDSHGNIRAWLYAVARNLFYNHQKKAKKEVLSEDISDAQLTEDILDQILQEEKLKNLYDGIRKAGKPETGSIAASVFCTPFPEGNCCSTAPDSGACAYPGIQGQKGT